MVQHADQDIAERLMRRRARIVPILAVLFLTGQAVYFGEPVDPVRNVDGVRIGAWLVWALALLLLLATGGGIFRSAPVRALMNDETTREHRQLALVLGFWAAMLGCVAVYFLSVFEPVSSREAVHIVLTVGIGTALLRFGLLERRALKDG